MNGLRMMVPLRAADLRIGTPELTRWMRWGAPALQKMSSPKQAWVIERAEGPRDRCAPLVFD
jgi:hypothetical protein